jgi:hypothetical protein
MKSPVTWFMSLLGYVPRPAKYADSICSLKIDVDSASVDASIKALDQLRASAVQTEEVMKSLVAAEGAAATAMLRAGFLIPSTEQFAATLIADPAQAELLNQIRALIEEMRQERQYNVRAFKKINGEWLPCSASDSGLPG